MTTLIPTLKQSASEDKRVEMNKQTLYIYIYIYIQRREEPPIVVWKLYNLQ